MVRIFDPEESTRPGAWQALMSGLQVDYDLLAAAQPAGQVLPVDPQIRALLDIARDKGHDRYGHFSVPNEIERLIAGCADAPRLSAMAVMQLTRGAAIGATGLDTLAERIKTAEAAGKTEDLRAFVLALTDAVHRRFIDRRSEREARSEIALRLCQWGLGLLALAIAMLLAGFLYSKVTADALSAGAQGPLRPPTTMFAVIGKWHLTALIYFGFFGAFFSRLIAFQTHAGAMTWDDLHKGYRNRVLVVRLMIGGFAALIFYYLVAGRILGGDAFPSFDTDPGKLGVFWHSAGVAGDGTGPDRYTIPSVNFAKLVVWSFLAGFAERFLPDQLSALEARARKGA